MLFVSFVYDICVHAYMDIVFHVYYPLFGVSIYDWEGGQHGITIIFSQPRHTDFHQII